MWYGILVKVSDFKLKRKVVLIMDGWKKTFSVVTSGNVESNQSLFNAINAIRGQEFWALIFKWIAPEFKTQEQLNSDATMSLLGMQKCVEFFCTTPYVLLSNFAAHGACSAQTERRADFGFAMTRQSGSAEFVGQRPLGRRPHLSAHYDELTPPHIVTVLAGLPSPKDDLGVDTR